MRCSNSNIFVQFRCQLHFSTSIYALARLRLYLSTVKMVYEPFPFLFPFIFWGVGVSCLFLSENWNLIRVFPTPDTFHPGSETSGFTKCGGIATIFPHTDLSKTGFVWGKYCVREFEWMIRKWKMSFRSKIILLWDTLTFAVHLLRTLAVSECAVQTRCHYSSFFGQIHIYMI